MRWICRSRTVPAARRTRRRECRDRGRRARSCRARTSCRRRAGKRWPATNSFRPQVEADALVDEFERIGALVVDRLLDDAGADHLVEEALHAFVGHGADAELEGVAGIDDAVLLHL